jgi:hypothetical protein
MKIFIPTNDCLTIAPDINKAASLRCLTIINGSIEEDILKPILCDLNENIPYRIIADSCLNSSEIIGPINNPLYQQYVITTGFSKEVEKELQKINCKVLTSSETNITNAIISFIKNLKNLESDYCCSP